MMLYETRSLAEAPEIRTEDGRLVASGVAIRYGARSKPILGRFVEEIRSGAVTKTLKDGDVLAFHEHQPAMMLGRLSAGTLRLTDSPSELRYEIDLPDTSAGRDVATLLERGDIRGSSFGFKAEAKEVRWSVLPGGMVLRSVGPMYLHHIATTCMPAYVETSAELAYRSLADARHVDLRSIIDAAERNELASLIDPSEEEERSEDDDKDKDEPDPAVLFRRPAWF